MIRCLPGIQNWKKNGKIELVEYFFHRKKNMEKKFINVNTNKNMQQCWFACRWRRVIERTRLNVSANVNKQKNESLLTTL
jgi:hypothetical protein